MSLMDLSADLTVAKERIKELEDSGIGKKKKSKINKINQLLSNNLTLCNWNPRGYERKKEYLNKY